ncbi:C-type lectin domain family 4 member M-like [Asterias rubens]|uniref:C-type lectin domain family 4 member M-like n=1 Tax=Asterias rubens TaxID=7604 RepID=UPI0014559A7A|nr:C-type lectin domain family 4 member M-like [Asterias rubens]
MHDAYVTWEEGKQICVELGGVMVVPQSEEELQHLDNIFSGQLFWIGCTDIVVEGTWVCFGEDTIDEQDERWAAGEPDSNGNEDCALRATSGWYDNGCDVYTNLICQRPA